MKTTRRKDSRPLYSSAIRRCASSTLSFRRRREATTCPTPCGWKGRSAAGALDIDLPLLRQISARLREANFRGTAVLSDGRLLDFEPGHTEADAFAVALDLGTTTLVAELLDLGTGSPLGGRRETQPPSPFRR